MENKAEIMQLVLKIEQISLLFRYVKLIAREVFPHVLLMHECRYLKGYILYIMIMFQTHMDTVTT